MADYEFNVASQDKHNEGEVFRIFHLDEEGVIGVEEDEPFELIFTNRTGNRVQVRLSVDGTDVLTGAPASTKPVGEMFLVGPSDTLKLKAWPETLQGGARFVFTTKEQSVAVNAHGNAAGIGLIAAAVYVDYSDHNYSQVWGSKSILRTQGLSRFNGGGGNYGTSRGSISPRRIGGTLLDTYKSNVSQDALSYDQSEVVLSAAVGNLAVGAGEQVDQNLVKTAGLSRPVLDEIVQLRYLPWSKLQTMLTAAQKASAFPGDQKQLDLSKVPRVKSTALSPEYRRFMTCNL